MLLWLAIPLAAAPTLVSRRRLGGVAGQVLLCGLGLAALHQGAGTLDPTDLRSIAAATPDGARFVSLTCGMLVSGACLLPLARDWRTLPLIVPLLFGLLVAEPWIAPGAVLLGILVGALPATFARLMPASRHRIEEASAPSRMETAMAAIALAASVVAPIPILAAVLIGAGWQCASRRPDPAAARVMAAAATGLIAAWGWLAWTIGGSNWMTLLHLGADAPISPAAAVLLALLLVAWGVFVAGPWPFERFAPASVFLLPVAVVIHLETPGTLGEGMMHWQPLVTLILAVSVLGAGVMRRPYGAAGALVLLAASRPGDMALAAALLIGAAAWAGSATGRIPAHWRDAASRAVVTVAATGAALVVAVVLRDEVLLAAVLALGMATAAGAGDRVVAPV